MTEARRLVLNGAPNNGMHPTRDTNLLMLHRRAGGRVMPGVRRFR
jgi:hypothetical protein